MSFTLTPIRPEKKTPEMKADTYITAKTLLGNEKRRRNWRTATLLMDERPPAM
jgi:hypothetical protein